MGWWFHTSWCNSEVSKSWAARLEHFVCHFSQYGSTWRSEMNFLYNLPIVIPRLPCLIMMAKAVSSTFELVNSVTPDSVISFNFAMCTVASKWFPIEPIRCSYGWWRTWWQMIHMIPGLPVSSIPQCKQNRQEDACLDWFQATWLFEPTFIEAHQPSKMICKVRSLKSQMKIHSFLEKIVTSSNEVSKDFECDMVVGIK